MRYLLVFSLLLAPLSAQPLERVLERVNVRVEAILDWQPGQSAPVLPPSLPMPEPRPIKAVRPKPQTKPKPSDGGAFVVWIRSYNGRVSAAQARLFASVILHYSEQHQVEPELVLALVAAESAFQPTAVSPVGARGLGQLMPGTAAMLGVADAFDPRQNLSGTVRYLSTQLRRFGSPRLALAAYNAGPGAVQRYGGVPPYRETQQYVSYVLKLYQELNNKKSVGKLAAEGV